ncbi:MAG: hydrolase family protein [Hydrocarboniphaga sp.]|uniref:fumarylacetoacetate hydrolase family protein n=1 Tax=Hydrocarboniphaga sp. TaxID=2033016 RepID=UPI00260EF884|nr:fumarylacetoacetate hydrolase family protein [Hydrocarboniphaga sp.]MDB5970002.1 hydrolase family protein [Hydrocarboniphaga sp.]
MKLISFRIQSQSGYGALKGDGAVDLSKHLGKRFPDLKSLLSSADGEGLKSAAGLLEGAAPDLRLEQIELLPPIPNPGTIWCAGMNTHSHFNEAKAYMGLKDLPPKPILFLRANATLVGSGQPLEKPKLEPIFDFEGEIALVIGKRGRNVPVESALDYIAGYSAFNDASARSYQQASPQITAGKNAYRSGGFGPCLATPDEVDLATMTMVCRVDGNEMQRMPVDDLIFSFAQLISFISEFAWLEVGDIMVTGSPKGIGALRNPRVLLVPGTRVEVEVSGVGTLVNDVLEQVLT